MAGGSRTKVVLANALASLAMLSSPTTPMSDRELAISRTVDVPPARLYQAWVTQLPLWWGPHGTTIPVCEMDLRPGGIFRTVMRMPDGSEYPTKGVFLEVLENQRIVFTDAFAEDWQPSRDIFFTAISTFEPLPNDRTHYTARALHWTVANRDKHEKMGFHQVWGESLDRLSALVTKV